jgi:DNA-binding PadR family transcriptional regulator
MRAEALKGHLDGLLLATLEQGPRHGYAIKEALCEATTGALDLPTGTVYPALHRLERARLIEGSWSVVEGRRRRTYELTTAGQAALAGARESWREFTVTISSALGSTPWPSTS